MEHLTFKIIFLAIFLITPVWSSNDDENEYCTKRCKTNRSFCDIHSGKCICMPETTSVVSTLGSRTVPVRNKGRSLLSSQCTNDDICKYYWCHSKDAYCDDGACICHPCMPRRG